MFPLLSSFIIHPAIVYLQRECIITLCETNALSLYLASTSVEPGVEAVVEALAEADAGASVGASLPVSSGWLNSHSTARSALPDCWNNTKC